MEIKRALKTLKFKRLRNDSTRPARKGGDCALFRFAKLAIRRDLAGPPT